MVCLNDRIIVPLPVAPSGFVAAGVRTPPAASMLKAEVGGDPSALVATVRVPSAASVRHATVGAPHSALVAAGMRTPRAAPCFLRKRMAP